MEERKRRLLEGLWEQLKEQEFIGEGSLFTADELGAPMDVLRAEIAEFGVELTSVLGEFFFIPLDDEGILYFSVVITLLNEAPKEAAADIAAAASRLNYYLPCGAYALGNDDRTLVYRNTLPLSADISDEALLKCMFTAADVAVGAAEGTEGSLRLVIKNEISVEEMVAMLTGSR